MGSEQVVPLTLGVLYPGEMGSVLGGLLRKQGFRTITTLAGRSKRTRKLCRHAQLEVVHSLQQLVDSADIVLSTVHPDSAPKVAEEYCACRSGKARQQCFVDLNSIAPATVAHIESMLADADVDFVDGAVHGMAAQLTTFGTIYLSGASAPAVAVVLERAARTRVLGDRAGAASAFKMLISGVNKGVTALLVEVCLAAREVDLLEPFFASCGEAYPGLMSILERTLPSYPQHAPRRVQELREAAQMVADVGLRPRMIESARQVIGEISAAGLPSDNVRSAIQILAELHAREVLKQSQLPDSITCQRSVE
ncbi:Phosphogluconate dehydrogenase, NAD-binding [Thiocapsa marina 5811]|uniref:Phosphogluconate dehydrogenase, NAD-binding n=2 Tax=Thiocapsa marina TaxID=244573 RepID=F9UDL4_9GAMM|nr:Phosphogluconate dehydrogenase, NAD-binding [Thiocapsa marina 5811]